MFCCLTARATGALLCIRIQVTVEEVVSWVNSLATSCFWYLLSLSLPTSHVNKGRGGGVEGKADRQMER